MAEGRISNESVEGTSRAPRGRSFASHARFLVFVLGAIGLLTALRVVDPHPVQTARATAFDLMQRASPREYVDAPVRIVDIDEDSLLELGQWPWPRDLLGEMVDRLHAAGAAVVAFDFLFVEPDRTSPSRGSEASESALDGAANTADGREDLRDHDKIFADAIQRGNVVLGFGMSPQIKDRPLVKAGFAYTGEDPAAYVSQIRGGARVLPSLAQAAAGIGSVNVSDERSVAVAREAPLLWSDGKRLFPSLVGEALRVAQGAQTYVVHADADGGVQSVRIGAFEVPTQPSGELYLHLTPSRADRFVSAVDLFDDQRLRELAPKLQGRIVLIGTSAAGLFDIHQTPLGQSVPGVEIHAQAIEQIITGQFLQRHDWTRSVEFLALIVASLIVGLTTRYASAWISFVVGGAAATLIALGAWLAYSRAGVLLDFSFPIFGATSVWFAATAFRYIVTDKEKREIRNAFSHYVSPTVLKQIERHHSQVRLGGENCELTVMFTDVRNFTPLSERLTPEELVAFLNTLLGRLGQEISSEQGIIDKFIGDAIMAFWNAPLRQPGHADQACAAALKMRAAVREMNQTHGFSLPEDVARDHDIEIGIGINTGPACVGNVGTADRFNYSALGDAVNVAARAESACKEVGYDLVVGRSTADHAPRFAFLDAGSVRLKGKAEPVPLTILVGDEHLRESPRFQRFAQHYEALLNALREGPAHACKEALAECEDLARDVEPGLVRYLDSLQGRHEDFRLTAETRTGLSAVR